MAEEIVFGGQSEKVSAEEKAAIKKRIAEAKGSADALKGSTPLGHVERPVMPDFNQLRQEKADKLGTEIKDGILSDRTKQELEGMGKILKDEKAKKDEAPSEKELDDEILGMFDGSSRTEAERILNNRKRKKAIESRCPAMKFEDLLMKDEVQQRVPILPGEFEPTFRSMLPEENLFIKRYLAKETSLPESYILEKYALCQLTCSVVAINGNHLPDHRDEKGELNEPKFEAKLKVMMRKSGYIIADLAINFYWFDLRVRRLINPEALGNG